MELVTYTCCELPSLKFMLAFLLTHIFCKLFVFVLTKHYYLCDLCLFSCYISQKIYMFKSNILVSFFFVYLRKFFYPFLLFYSNKNEVKESLLDSYIVKYWNSIFASKLLKRRFKDISDLRNYFSIESQKL